MKHLAINTGGGDAPGLNAVICAVARSADRLGGTILGTNRQVPLDGAVMLTARTLGSVFGD